MPRLYSHGGRSVTRILSTQSESAGSKLVSASGPLSLCPQCCLHSSLCSPAAMQPTALGRALYVESVTMHCSEHAGQGQVRIQATGTFTFSTGVKIRTLLHAPPPRRSVLRVADVLCSLTCLRWRWDSPGTGNSYFRAACVVLIILHQGHVLMSHSCCYSEGPFRVPTEAECTWQRAAPERP